MHKCPNCGYEEPLKPYQYNGILKPHLPTILKLARAGRTALEIKSALDKKHDNIPYGAKATISYIVRCYGIKLLAKQYDRRRNSEIAAKYEAGGTTLEKIAQEYKITRERVRQIIYKVRRLAQQEAELAKSFRYWASPEDPSLLQI